MKTLIFVTICLFSSVYAQLFEPNLLQSLFEEYTEADPLLRENIEGFRFHRYSYYFINHKYLFYIDDVPDLIKGFLRQGLLWEPDVRQQISKYTRWNSTAVDIGGHIGTHTLHMSRNVGKGGKVVVFEPQVKLFTELVINMHLNKAKNIQFFRNAVGANHALVEMNPHFPENEGGVSLGKGGDPVEMIPLDSLNLSNVSFIKIDVEGNEEEVIKGARETILQNKPFMVVEIMGGVPYEIANSEQKIEIHRRAEKIEELGYLVTHMGEHNYLCIPI